MDAKLNLNRISEGKKCPFKIQLVLIVLITKLKNDLQRGHKYAKMRLKEKKMITHIYRYKCPRKKGCNIMGAHFLSLFWNVSLLFFL